MAKTRARARVKRPATPKQVAFRRHATALTVAAKDKREFDEQRRRSSWWLGTSPEGFTSLAQQKVQPVVRGYAHWDRQDVE